MEDWMFQKLGPEREEQFRAWARQNFEPGKKLETYWHPVVQDEWRRCQENYDRQQEKS